MSEVKRYTFKGAAGEYVYAPDFDAQRLRADTTEATVAEREEALSLKQRDLIEAQTAVTGWARKHAAAEQRIADLISMLRGAMPAVKYESKRGDDAGQQYRLLVKKIDAALNQKSEGESQ